MDYPKEVLIHELFEQQAERTPEAVAVQYEEQQLTYAQLNAKANQLAHRLRAMRDAAGAPVVKPDTLVAISVERSLEMVVGLLGTLKAGAAYVPVDPEYPAERIAYMLEDSQAKVLLTQKGLRDRLSAVTGAADTDDEGVIGEIMLLDEESAYAGQPEGNISREETGQTSSNLAYVIYTSGSTGLPKGVMIEHSGVCNLAQLLQKELRVDETSRVLQFASFSFDACVWEVVVSLLHGASLHLSTKERLMPGEPLRTLLLARGITHAMLPPMALSALGEPEGLESLQTVSVGGDVCPPQLAQQWSSAARFVNAYGPTEATVCATMFRVEPEWAADAGQSLPIGGPVANARVYILDEQRKPVPLGVAGELYVGGAGVARGYLNRVELTAERFMDDPFSDEPDARMYRSGDLGYWRADGLIEFVGRNDFQVKIRGFRVELGEIEARLGELPGVRDAVVLAREDQPGDRRLVAYWTPAQGQPKDELPRPEQLRDTLKESLPSYMVPVAFVQMEALPLTPNGKVDRKALPVPDVDALVTHEYEAPQGEVEQRMALLWQELLGVERVGRNDNFFDLGGNSLLMVALLARLRDDGLFASAEAGYSSGASAMKDLAAQLVRRSDGENAQQTAVGEIPEACTRILPKMVGLASFDQAEIDAIVARVPGGASNIRDICPLSTTQEGILFHHRLDEKRDAYVVHEVFRFDSVARFEAFFAALQELVRRHEALRTIFVWSDLPEPVQVVQRHAEPVCTRMMLDAGQDAAGAFRQWLQPRFERLDLGRAPLVGMVLGEVAGKKECYGALTIHHIITDHVSIEVMLAEIGALMQGQDRPQPAQDGQVGSYRRFVEHSRDAGERARAEAFFKDMLADYDEPSLPFGLQDVRGDGTAIVQRISPVEQALARQVRRVARSLRVSPAIVFHLVFGLVVGRFSGRDDVVFGTVMSGRMAPVAGIDHMLGMFINVLPLRLNMAGLAVREALLQLEQSMAGLIRHESASLALAQRCSGVEGDVPLFSALFNYRHGSMHDSVRGMDGVEFVEELEATNYPFVLSVDDTGDGFVFVSQTDPSVDAGQVIEYLHCALQQVVGALQRESTLLVRQFDIMPQRAREQVIRVFNATQADYPKEALIHELFEQQVERTPEAVAVQYEEESLTYAQLNA
ncbi:non-ribosomal peptide synthetase, partial [Lautropia dentalis]